MKKFNSHSEITEAFNSEKYDIFFESGNTKYQVKHLGSTIYCYDPVHNLGRGAITKFDVSGFYAIEKPVQVENNDESESSEE